jgi:hypothetical protein
MILQVLSNPTILALLNIVWLFKSQLKKKSYYQDLTIPLFSP